MITYCVLCSGILIYSKRFMLISISIRVLEYRFRLCLICGLQLDAWQAVFGVQISSLFNRGLQLDAWQAVFGVQISSLFNPWVTT